MRKPPIKAVTEAARRYPSAVDAAQALGITAGAFKRLCKQHEIPWEHRAKQWSDGASKKYQDKCATKGCNSHPSSNGLCFGCYAKGKRNERV